MLEYTAVSVETGSIVVVASCGIVRHIHLTGRKDDRVRRLVEQLHPNAACRPRLMPAFQTQIRRYFAGQRVRFDVDYDLSDMTPFQQRVLNACAALDYGQTVTYGELARRIGHPRAARAVGTALARNPIPLVIPCHRVVGCNGSLGGFSAEQGVRVKRLLLDLEQAGHAVGPTVMS